MTEAEARKQLNRSKFARTGLAIYTLGAGFVTARSNDFYDLLVRADTNNSGLIREMGSGMWLLIINKISEMSSFSLEQSTCAIGASLTIFGIIATYSAHQTVKFIERINSRPPKNN